LVVAIQIAAEKQGRALATTDINLLWAILRPKKSIHARQSHS